MSARRRFILINPNTSAATTAAMVAIAHEAAPNVDVEGLTAAFGAPLIFTPEALATASDAVAAACEAIPAEGCDGVIVSAFGDPGLAAARTRLTVPAVGIAEASMSAAARIGRFSVVTTTPLLVDAIEAAAGRYGHAGRFVSVRLTDGDLAEIMADPERLREALAAACRVAVEQDHVDAIIIGGGPLAVAARALRASLPVPIVEPIPCAVALLLSEIQGT